MVAVVSTVAVLLEVLPICVDPLYDETAKVPVNDLMDAIAFKSVVLCADVSVTVRFAVPFDQESPEIVRMVVLPFLSTSVLV
ncbi:unknown [Ruminococcus sp. CAG:579]|nr:unknown [Ruminococcus sp. CAG:579]